MTLFNSKTITLTDKPNCHIQPRFGDVVIPLGGEYIGAHALISNQPGLPQDRVYLGFNVSGTKEPGCFDSISCSGGPFIDVAKIDLKYIGTTQQSFLNSRNILANDRNKRYEKYEETVNVWSYQPHSVPEYCMRRFTTYSDLLADIARFNTIYTHYIEECNKFAFDANQHDTREVMRLNHEVVNHRKSYTYTADKIAMAMFEAYASNSMIFLHKQTTQQGYFCKDFQFGIYVKTEKDFHSLIEAYGIDDLIFDEEILCYRFTPNINTRSWAKLRTVTYPVGQKSM